MELPEVLAWPEEEAVSFLKEQGWSVVIKETAPPWLKPSLVKRRVLRLRLTADNRLEVLVGQEGFEGR